MGLEVYLVLELLAKETRRETMLHASLIPGSNLHCHWFSWWFIIHLITPLLSSCLRIQ